MSKYQIYKYGLYGRCTICKSVQQEKCRFCGELYLFTDSSKPGYYLCTNCNTHNLFVCSTPECNSEPKVLRTPNNDEEKQRIDEFISRMKDDNKNRRNFVIKSSVKKTVVQAVEVDVSESEIIKSAPSAAPQPDFIPPKNRTVQSQVKVAEINDQTLKSSIETAQQQKDEKEAKLIRDYWAGRIKEDELKPAPVSGEPEKIVAERRIVNEFYDDAQENDELDTQKTFVNSYDEIVYHDCYVCGEKEVRIICDRCGNDDQFSLNFDFLSCKCGNEIKIMPCRCGAKIGHNDFYLISNGVKWQYSQSRSYYNYRKGRMMIFSDCPSCGIFSAEKCTSCGSKVNFGKPNSKNMVYCKHCGTINQYKCENPKCKGIIKTLKNPSSMEEKLDWINKARNIKSGNGQEKISEDSRSPKPKAAQVNPLPMNSISDSFMDIMEQKNKELITNSFVNEVEERVNEQKIIKKQLVEHNKKQIEFIYHTKSSFKDYIWYILLGIVLVIGGAGYIYYAYFM